MTSLDGKDQLLHGLRYCTASVGFILSAKISPMQVSLVQLPSANTQAPRTSPHPSPSPYRQKGILHTTSAILHLHVVCISVITVTWYLCLIFHCSTEGFGLCDKNSRSQSFEEGRRKKGKQGSFPYLTYAINHRGPKQSNYKSFPAVVLEKLGVHFDWIVGFIKRQYFSKCGRWMFWETSNYVIWKSLAKMEWREMK